MQKLIACGADVNSEDVSGQTALFYSAREGFAKVSELLISSGAVANKLDKHRLTPLYLAKKLGKMEVRAGLV